MNKITSKVSERTFAAFCVIILFSIFSCSRAESSEGQKEENLKIAILGDSMTWIGGDNFEKPIGWTHYLTDLPIVMKSYARSGATWTNTTETKGDTAAYSEVLNPENVIYNQTLRLINDRNSFSPDLIIIFAGGNDAWFTKQRPGIFSIDTVPEIPAKALPSQFTSLAGSIALNIKLLKESFPKSRICLLTPVHGAKMDPASIEKVGNLIQSAGEALAVQVIRGDRLIPFSHEEESGPNRRFTYDGVHSNAEGAKAIAKCIKENIIQLTSRSKETGTNN